MTTLPPRVLLGEDNPQDVYLIHMAFAENGIKPDLVVVNDGGDMLDELGRLTHSTWMPDLIVLDLNLPRHDGLEILAYIGKRDILANVPLVILTSSDSPRDVSAAARLGFHNYIRKPSSLDEFLAIGSIFRTLIESKQCVAGSAAT